MEDVRIEKLVHGGQGIGALADGRKVFVWNALPGELVRVRIIKKKRSYVEAIAEEIIEPSAHRIESLEENYLATSPWQIMAYDAENTYKREIVAELMNREHVDVSRIGVTMGDGRMYEYRNKMEYSFWGDDNGLHLALYRRGSHGKQIVTGSALALPAVDAAARALLAELQGQQVRAGDLQSAIIRVQQDGAAVACLFVKPDDFPKLTLSEGTKGLKVYHSNPKSPASVATKLLYELGDVGLRDKVRGQWLSYAAEGFFQVNIPVFEQTVQAIKTFIGNDPVVDMYGGVGSISIGLQSPASIIVEVDAACVAMARHNAETNGRDISVIAATAETAVEYITPDRTLLVDPPRAGLHQKVTEKIILDGPKKVVYLSCNPATQARDLAMLQHQYDIQEVSVYNFFPRTPHIETLALLERK